MVDEFEIAVISASPPKIVWTRDRKSLIYVKGETLGVSNLWQQSLNGGEPQKLTNFASEHIYDFGFSPDGSRLALVRGSMNHDAILLEGFK